MTLRNDSSDASYYFYANATAGAARMDSAAVCGNVADAMKNGVVRVITLRVAPKIARKPSAGEAENLRQGSEEGKETN